MRRSRVRGGLYRYLVPVALAIAVLCGGGAQASVGDYLYDWGAPYQFVVPSGIAAGDDGRIYVGDVGNPVFDPAGNLVGRLNTPNGGRCADLAIAPDGRIYGLCGPMGVVGIFDAGGNYLGGFGAEGTGDGQFYYATSIAVSNAGEVYVADAWHRTIQIFDRDGTYLRKWTGTPYSKGMAFDASGDLFVADYLYATIRRYSPAGTQVDWWRVTGEWAARINGLAIDRAAREVAAIVEHTGEVHVYSIDGQGYDRPPVRSWHGDESGVGRVSAGRAKDLAIDGTGTVYIAEGHSYGNDYSMIKTYDRSGAFQSVWRARGDAEGRFAFPVSGAIAPTGEVLVADNGNRRIQRFGPDGAFAGKFALQQGCDTIEVEQGDDGLVYVMDLCYLDDGWYHTFVTGFTTEGVPMSRFDVGTGYYYEGFAVASGRVYVADGGRVNVFGTDGTLLGAFSSTHGLGTQWNSGPPLYKYNPYAGRPYLRKVYDIEFAADGLLYVLDAGTDVVAFDVNGTAVRWVPLGTSPTVYRTIAVDQCGDIFAIYRAFEQYPASSAAAFDRSGVPLRTWGTQGVMPGQFRAAFGIAADDDGRVFVVERDNHRVQVFEGLLGCGQPVASAGADRTAHPGVALTLDGGASTDPAGQQLAYSWQIVSAPAGSAAVLSETSTATPTLVPDLLGDYLLELVVTSGSGRVSEPDQVLVTAANQPPTADAGPDQPVTLIGTIVTLAGSGFDPDGDALSYAWQLLELPVGSAAALSDPGSAAPTFVADRNGSYLLRLTVADGWGGSATDTMLVSFLNVPPVAEAGLAQSVVQGTFVQLDGSASSDGNGDSLTYVWTLVQVPDGSAATLAGQETATPSFVADVPGAYAVTLVVSDGIVDSPADLVTVTAVSYEDALTQELVTLLTTVNGFPHIAFAAKNMQDTLGIKINSVIEKVEAGNYAAALNQVQNDLLPKMDGCVLGEDGQTADWIPGCEEQQQVYPLLLQIIDLLIQVND